VGRDCCHTTVTAAINYDLRVEPKCNVSDVSGVSGVSDVRVGMDISDVSDVNDMSDQCYHYDAV
jgi:hypothetical protein